MFTLDADLAEAVKAVPIVVLDGRRCQVLIRKLRNGGSFESFWTYVARVSLMQAHGGKLGR